MSAYVKTVMIVLLIGSCFGCADNRARRSDEQAMMIYRDCMGGMPPHWEANDASAGLGSKHVASAGAGADSHRESRQHIECVQQAGWEEQ